MHIDAVFRSTDGPLPEGELTGWGYPLTQDDGRWVIWSEGQG